MSGKNAEYAIITSFKFKDSDFVWSLYKLWLIFKIRLRIILQFYRKKKVQELQKSLQELRSRKHKIIGHPSLLLSLFRGFDELDISFTYNQITCHTKYIILCWADAKDIEYIKKIRIGFPNIKCVVTAPTACKYNYSYQYMFAQEDCIDFSLVASDWVKESYKTKMPRMYWNKVIPWASGVALSNCSYDNNIMGGGGIQI